MKTKKPQEIKIRSHLALKIVAGVVIAIALFFAVTSVITLIGNNANAKKVKSFDKIAYDSQLVPNKDADENYCFVTDNDLKIVQLTDVHIGGGWLSTKKDAQALNTVAALLTEEKPDFVIVTGDIAYPVPFQSGTINNKNGAKLFAELMEQLGVYWTFTFGNHDTEAYSFFDRKEISGFYQKYEHCIHNPGDIEVDGESNQIINIKGSDGLITQSLFLFDSHSYTDDDKLGMRWHYDKIHDNQIEWYKDSLAALNEQNEKTITELGGDAKSDIKSLAFFHIPPVEMKEAWNEYAQNGYKDTENVKLISGFAGGTGKIVYCSHEEDQLIETFIELGSTQGAFFGHDHRNCMSMNYKGVRLTYGMSIDYLAIPGIYKIGLQRGCTVIDIHKDGSFDCHNENYYQDKYQTLYEKEQVEMQELTYPNALTS